MKTSSTTAPGSRLAALALCLAAGPAAAEIYKWVDASGRTVYSNIAPVKTAQTKNLQVVVEDPPPEAAAAAQQRREQDLLERIQRLERQVQQAQSAPPPYLPPYAPPYATQYTPPPPPAFYPAPYYVRSYYPVRVVMPRAHAHAAMARRR